MKLVLFTSFAEGKSVYVNPEAVQLVTMMPVTNPPGSSAATILLAGGLSYQIRGSLVDAVDNLLVDDDAKPAGDYSDWEEWNGQGSPALPTGTLVLIHTAIGDSPNPVPVENVDWSVPDPKGPGTVLAYKVVR